METVAYTGSTRWHELTVKRIPVAAPFEWLAKGWNDMRTAGWRSFAYGTAVVLISGLLTLGLVVTGKLFFLPFLLAGFFLIAPAVGLGLYQMSAHLELGEPLQTCNALEAWKRNHTQIGILIGGFFIILQLWFAANFVLFALLYQGISPPLDNFFSNLLLSEKGRPLAVASFIVGFGFAWCAYTISAISVPMLIDRQIDGFTAIRFSIRAVLENFLPMMLWALLIVLVVGVGLITFYIGLIVALPIIGHASWHAYRALIPSAR